MYVLGTAGHVDHGKSVLVHALTGIDPDRLREEKEREMTIDLGFAWLKLPSGREISIVDVPGHERFIKNMLAGVGGIDLALLVVAADEGIMPQTREHLAILHLLHVERGIVAITKRDLVDEEWLELVSMEVGDLIQGTTLAQAPILPVSAVNGEGLGELVSTIDSLLDTTPPKNDIGRPRLPIDRAFTVAGFGVVVTGTLIDGHLSLGQEVEILPQGVKSRIRGLETHKRKIEIALPSSRVAANLAGIATGELERGDVVTNPGWFVPTKAVDARLCLLPHLSRPLTHNTTITFYTGATEVEAKVRLLEKEKLEPEEASWAQFIFPHPIAVAKGDLFIIRSPRDTLGGGEIVDPHARRHRRFHAATINSLAAREKGTPEEILLATLEAKEPSELRALLAYSNLSSDEASRAIQTLASQKKVIVLGDKGSRSLLFSASGWKKLEEKVKETVQYYHRQFPLRRGMPKEELRGKLKLQAPSFAAILRHLLQDGALVEEGVTVCLPFHQVQLTKEQQAQVDAYLSSLNQDPYSSPSEFLPSPELLDLLIEQRQIVKVSDNIIFAASAYDEMVQRIIGCIKLHGKITVGEVRNLFQTSRKYAVALMEHLDERKITRRIGDERVLR
jgi:selenocysteine-specific elongation factor